MSGYSVSRSITAVATVLSTVLCLLFVAIMAWLVSLEATRRREALLHSTRTIMQASEARLEEYIAVGRMLAQSPALTSGDIAAFETETRRASAALRNAWILLADVEGKQLFNTALANGLPGPLRTPNGKAHRRALETNSVQVSDIGVGPAVQEPVITVNVPISAGVEPRYVLTITFRASTFADLMSGLPAYWIAGIIDSEGNFIARSIASQEMIGKPASEGWRKNRFREGVFNNVSLEGEWLVSATVPSKLTGWAASVAVRSNAFYVGFWETIATAVAFGAGAIILCLALIFSLGRRLRAAMNTLTEAAKNIGPAAPKIQRTGAREIDLVIDAFNIASAQLAAHERWRDDHERQMRLLAQEVQHRSRNMMTVVTSIASLVGRAAPDFASFKEKFSAQLGALARCQNLLDATDRQDTDIATLVADQCEPFAAGRIKLQGELVLVPKASVQPLALVFHELAMNALKHGALSVPEGKVEVSWQVMHAATGEPIARFAWVETGGPSVQSPEREGAGRGLNAASCMAMLNGKLDLDFRAEGLVCQFSFPLS